VWFVCPTNTSRCCVVCVLDMGHGRARALPKCHPCLLQGCPWYSHTPPTYTPSNPMWLHQPLNACGSMSVVCAYGQAHFECIKLSYVILCFYWNISVCCHICLLLHAN